MHGQIFDKPDLKPIATKYKKSVAQLIVRWNLQKGVVVIPKSVKKERIIENTDVFDFSISDEDMLRIDKLDCNLHSGADPDNFDF